MLVNKDKQTKTSVQKILPISKTGYSPKNTTIPALLETYKNRRKNTFVDNDSEDTDEKIG